MERVKEVNIRNLGDVASPRKGKIHPTEAPEITFIGLEHIEAHTMKLIGKQTFGELRSAGNPFKTGDVLYSRLRPYLNNFIVAKEDGACSGEFIVLTPKETVSSNLLAYRLNSSDFVEFAKSLNAGDRPRVDWSEISSFPVLLPSTLAEQHALSAHLDLQFSRLDAAVEALRRALANLKRYRASVLQAAVTGRLVPTEHALAQAEGRDYETGEQLLQRILTERRRTWSGKGKYKEPVASEAPINDLPPGWSTATFDQISRRVTVGYVGTMKHEYVGSGVPFLRSQNVRENRFDPKGLLYITERFHEQLSKSRLQPGDLAVVRSGSVGTTCVIPDSIPQANCSDLVLIQQPIGFIPQYGAYVMNSFAKRAVKAGTVGVALAHFNTQSVAMLQVPLPPLAEQARIVAEVERRLSVADQLEQTLTANLSRATRLRQAILKKAFELPA